MAMQPWNVNAAEVLTSCSSMGTGRVAGALMLLLPIIVSNTPGGRSCNDTC